MRGRKPEFRPRFSSADMERVHEVLRQHKAPISEVRRAKLAALLAANREIRSTEAARHLGAHEQFVRKWRRRWTREGFSLVDKPRPGRPREFSPQAGRRHQGRGLRAAGAA